MAKISNLGQSFSFNIDKLRKDIASGKRTLRITTHAQIEAFKDGLLLKHLRQVFEQGEVIEIYPDDRRGLLYDEIVEYNVPVHIVVEDTPEEGVVITAYIPDKGKWIADKQRRTQRKKKK
ncbi:MAG: DUF4258 domain-containing protein [Anaerolineae bacterium]|nr:DUF4258 domain-containing protein [Anaerolineae bacterium]